MKNDSAVQSSVNFQKIAEFSRPTVFGEFNVVSYNQGNDFAFAVTRGSFPKDNLLVRVQSACMFGESLGVNSCDCAEQLRKALEIGSKQSNFLLVYLMYQEGRGHGMFKKIKAIEVEAKQNVDMVEAFKILEWDLDLRDYQIAAQIIRDINSDRPICLLTNNPKKLKGLQQYGIQIAGEQRLWVDDPNQACKRYLTTKRSKMGHLLPEYE